MSKIISISIDELSLIEFDRIVKANDSDRSKMLRKWIREHRVVVESEPMKDKYYNELIFEE